MRAILGLFCMKLAAWLLARAITLNVQHCGAQHFHKAAHCNKALAALRCEGWRCSGHHAGNALYLAIRGMNEVR